MSEFWEEFREVVWVVLVATVLFCVVLAIIGAMVAYTDRLQCAQRWEKSGMQSDWGFIKGCMLKTPAGLIPESAYRMVE